MRRLNRLGLVGGLACLVAGMGCDRGFFRAQGYVASEGGALGNWRSAPVGCTRDPFDGRPISRSESIATFLWEDPSVHDPLRELHRDKIPDEPMRMEVAHDGEGFSAGMTTVKTEGIRIVSEDCSEFRVEMSQEPPVVAGARWSLSGRVQMDCQVKGSRVTADLRFKRCEF